MSHFIIRFIPLFIFGIPNGQASTQLLQAMQRGLRSVSRALDRVRRAYLRAGRGITVHADDGHGLRRVRAIDVVQLDHRLSPVRIALRARLNAGVAPDTPVRVDEELHGLRGWHRRGVMG